MRFLSLFSGIEAASAAWTPLGWECIGVAEVDPFACALLAHHYRDVPNLGDVCVIDATAIAALGRIDVVVAGFPCQDVSVAGQRAGFGSDGERTRSGLFYEADRILRLTGARWCVLENVPGLLSSQRGRDFAVVVGALAGCEFDVPDGGWKNAGVAAGPLGLVEWAVLDAQFFGLAQRRQRVFVVRDSGDWANRQPVLLERASLRWDPAPSREAGEGSARELAPCLGASGRGFGRTGDPRGQDALVAHALRADGFDASEDGTGRGTPLVSMALNAHGGSGRLDAESETLIPFDTTQVTSAANRSSPQAGDPCHPLAAGAHAPAIAFNGRINPVHGAVTGALDTDGATQCVAFDPGQSSNSKTCFQESIEQAPPLLSGQGAAGRMAVVSHMAVRRLTPTECERLMGYPDGYTAIPYRGKPAADGPRYRALGNSIAVPVLRWIGQRIAAVDAIPR